MEISDFQTPQYPPYVQTTEQRRRWDYCRANSILYCGENGQPAENTESEDVWMMTRSLYRSDIPTDPPSDDADRQVRQGRG